MRKSSTRVALLEPALNPLPRLAQDLQTDLAPAPELALESASDSTTKMALSELASEEAPESPPKLALGSPSELASRASSWTAIGLPSEPASETPTLSLSEPTLEAPPGQALEASSTPPPELPPELLSGLAP